MADWSRNIINVSSDETFSGSSIFKGSDETYDIFCVPCQEIEKKFLPADGYCINCEEHLCFDCCSKHSKYKASRKHKLQDKHTTPQSKPVTTSSIKKNKHRATHSKPVATKSSSKTSITSLRTVAKDSTPGEINIKSSTDEPFCWITGMALLPNSQLVITDNKNGKVKLIDTKHCKIVSELSLDKQPWDITSVQDGRLAVTLPCGKKIQFLTISSHSLSLDSDISVNGLCHGIAYKDKTLIVTFIWPGKVEIISLSGELIRSIEMDNTGARIFECPYYVALTNDNTGMYASDQENHSVTFLTLDGNGKSAYKAKTLNFLRALCVDQDGRVFLADSSGTVHQLVPGTDKIQPLLDFTHGISSWPFSLAYCDGEDKLYVGMYCDVIQVFQLQ